MSYRMGWTELTGRGFFMESTRMVQDGVVSRSDQKGVRSSHACVYLSKGLKCCYNSFD
jgi:hypothetical protein